MMLNFNVKPDVGSKETLKSSFTKQMALKSKLKLKKSN